MVLGDPFEHSYVSESNHDNWLITSIADEDLMLETSRSVDDQLEKLNYGFNLLEQKQYIMENIQGSNQKDLQSALFINGLSGSYDGLRLNNALEQYHTDHEELVTEGLGDAIKKAYEWVKKQLIKLYKAIKGFFKKLWNWITGKSESVEKKAVELKKEIGNKKAIEHKVKLPAPKKENGKVVGTANLSEVIKKEVGGGSAKDDGESSETYVAPYVNNLRTIVGVNLPYDLTSENLFDYQISVVASQLNSLEYGPLIDPTKTGKLTNYVWVCNQGGSFKKLSVDGVSVNLDVFKPNNFTEVEILLDVAMLDQITKATDDTNKVKQTLNEAIQRIEKYEEQLFDVLSNGESGEKIGAVLLKNTRNIIEYIEIKGKELAVLIKLYEQLVISLKEIN
jgi:hypothetical protein